MAETPRQNIIRRLKAILTSEEVYEDILEKVVSGVRGRLSPGYEKAVRKDRIGRFRATVYQKAKNKVGLQKGMCLFIKTNKEEVHWVTI